MSTYLGMTDQQWAAAAEHFGLQPDEAAAYRLAFEEAQTLGVPAFLDAVLEDLRVRYLLAVKQGVKPTALEMKLLEARKVVAVELAETDWLNQLAAFEGTVQ